jgi:hypothetical protein
VYFDSQDWQVIFMEQLGIASSGRHPVVGRQERP